MTHDTCPIPKDPATDEEAAIERLLGSKRLAVVGISTDASRPSYYVSEYLQKQGYIIMPVNPAHTEVLGAKCVASLAQLKQPADMVLVFRRNEFCAEVTREAIAAGAGGVWLQSGIVSDEARRLAAEAGIPFVQDRCMMVEHRRRVSGRGIGSAPK
jgi:predicted CoA-binding protein